MSFGIPVRNALPIGAGSALALSSGLGPLLNSALAGFDPDSISGTNPVTGWLNRKYGGPAYDLDTVVGTGANLSTLDTGVALHTGTDGDNFSTPNAAANRITGSLTLIGYVTPFDWSPSSIQTLISKWEIIENERAYLVTLQTDGTFNLLTSTDGTVVVTSSSTAATGFTGGTGHWWQITWNDSTDKSNFFTSNDARNTDPLTVIWSQLGDTDISHVSAGINGSSAPVEIGSNRGGAIERLAGKTARTIIISGTDETAMPAVDFNPADADPGVAIDTDTWTSSTTSEVWTVNGDAFVNNTGHTGIYSRGSVGLETTSGQLINSPVTVYAVFKPTLAAPGASQRIFSARSNTAAEMLLATVESASDKYRIDQGSSLILAEGFDNTLQVYTAQFLGTASSKLTVSAGSVTGDAGSENWDFATIFAASNNLATMQGLFLELLVFNSAHNSGEISRIQNFLAAKYSV